MIMEMRYCVLKNVSGTRPARNGFVRSRRATTAAHTASSLFMMSLIRCLSSFDFFTLRYISALQTAWKVPELCVITTADGFCFVFPACFSHAAQVRFVLQRFVFGNIWRLMKREFFSEYVV